MADENEIRVVITGVASDLRRALEGAKGDLGGLKAAIKDVPNQVRVDVNVQTAEAATRLRELQRQIGRTPDKIKIDVDVDSGVADARLRLLQQRIRDTERDAARLSLFGSSGGGGGFGSTFLRNLGSGGLPLGGPLALGAGAAPLAAGAAGSATAILGSAGAGLLGAGAIGTAGLGSLIAGIGPLIALSGGLKDAIALSGKLEIAQKNLAAAQQIYGGQNKALATAQSNYNAAVAAFGPTSARAVSAHNQLLLVQAKGAQTAPQIISAQNALNKLMIEANPAVLAFAKSWGNVTDGLEKAESQVLPAMASTLKPVLATFAQLLPTLVQMARIDLGGIARGLAPLLDFLRSAGFRAALVELSDTFASIAGPLGQAATNLIRALLSVAVAASPFLIQIAQSFERWTRSFADSVSPGQHLITLITGLVGQFHSWLDLAGALGHVVITLLKSGAQQGQGLVDQLTHILDRWNAWLGSSAGQAALHKFFAESLGLLRGVAQALGAIAPLIASMAVGLIPAMTLLLKPLADILTSISHWVNDLSKGLPPVIKALPGLAVAVGVLASWKALQAVVSATTALMLGKVGLGAGAAAGAAGLGTPATTAAGGGIGAIAGALAIPAVVAAVLAAEGFKSPLSPGTVQPGLASLLGPVGAQANLANREQLPTRGGGGSVGPVGFASGQVSQTTQALQKLQDQLKGIVDPAQLSREKLISLHDEVISLSQLPDLTRTQREGLHKLTDALDPVNVATRQAEKIWGAAFQSIDATTGNVMTQVQSIIATQTAAITANLKRGTPEWTTAIATSYGSAIGALQRLNAAGVLSTSKMVSDINQLLTQELKALGADPAAVKKLGAQTAVNVLTGNLPAGLVPTGAGLATGGYEPAAPGGKVIRVAEGGFPEVVLTTDPKHSQRQRGLLAQYLRAAPHVLGYAGGGMITAPQLNQPGIFGQVEQAAVNKVAAAFNQMTAQVGAGGAIGAGAFSGVPGSGGTSGANQALGRAMMLAAGWPASEWPALQALWNQESGWNANAVNSTSGAYGIPQSLGHGHPFNLGDARAQIAWGLSYIRSVYGSPSGAEAHERAFNWYGAGGFIPGFASGGIIGQAVSGLGVGAHPISGGLPGAGLLAQGAGAGDPIGPGLAAIAGLIGPDGDVNRLGDRMSYWQGIWGLDQTVSGIMAGGPSAAILTNPATGQTSINQAGVGTAIARLSQQVGWESSIVGDLHSALSLSQQLIPKIRAAIKRRQDQVKAIQAKIRANLARIAQLQKQITTEQAKKKPDHSAIAGWRKQILGLQQENMQLGGSQSSVGAGGEIAGLSAQLSTLTSELQTVSAYPDQIAGAGASGYGGQLGPARTTLAQLQQELAALSPGALANALAASTPPAAAAALGQSAVNPLLASQLAATQQALGLSQAQFGVLGGFSPLLTGRLVGSFASGIDFVPRTGVALVHRGETILPDPQGPYGNRAAATVQTAQGPTEVVLVFQNNEPALMKLVDARMNQKALQITSDHAGQRARLLSGVRRP